MEKEDISALFVTDEGKVVGFLTETDIVNRLISGKERKLKATQIHVSSAMNPDFLVISSSSDFRDAARLMVEKNVSSLPVVEGDDVIGILTKTDLVSKIISSEEKVGEFYSKNPLLVNPADTLVSASKLIASEDVNHLLVTDNGQLIGILTKKDIVSGLRKFRKALDKSPHSDIKGICVEHVMTNDPVTITSEATIGEAASIMLSNKISGIPVIASELGIITKTDIIAGIARDYLP